MNLNPAGSSPSQESGATLAQTAHDYLDWYQRATVLRHAGRYEEALASCEKT